MSDQHLIAKSDQLDAETRDWVLDLPHELRLALMDRIAMVSKFDNRVAALAYMALSGILQSEKDDG